MSESNLFWLGGHATPALPALGVKLDLDAAIIGAGMIGLHCALHLCCGGLRGAVF